MWHRKMYSSSVTIGHFKVVSLLHCRQQTKPVLIGDAGAEDLMYTAWCGRLIPKAFSTDLPPLVAEAAQSTDKGATAWRLTSSRLWCVVGVSRLVYKPTIAPAFCSMMICGRMSAG